MFSQIVSPVIAAVRSWMAEQTYKAAQAGAAEGLHKFAVELARASALPAPAPEAVPLVMASAAQVTEAATVPGGGTVEPDDQHGPAIDATNLERLKELVQGGTSQREAARQLGISESTARRWLKAS